MEEAASIIKVNNLESSFSHVQSQGGDSRDFDRYLYDAQKPGDVGDRAQQELTPAPRFYPVSPDSDLDLDALRATRADQQLDRPEQVSERDFDEIRRELHENERNIDQSVMEEKSVNRQKTERIHDATH